MKKSNYSNSNLFLSYLFFLCSLGIVQSQEYFEGEIYYHIEYDLLNDKLSKNILIQEMGDSIVAYIKSDKFILMHNTKGKLGNKRTIFLLKEGYGYIDFEKSDTIMKFGLSKKSGELIKFSRNYKDKRHILNELCESITIEFKTIKNDLVQEHRGKYYFSSKKQRLDPKFYKNYKNNYWNLFVQESESISLRNEIEYFPAFKFVQQAYAIVKREIPDSIFQINKNKHVKLISSN